jgi:hypothetical protein
MLTSTHGIDAIHNVCCRTVFEHVALYTRIDCHAKEFLFPIHCQENDLHGQRFSAPADVLLHVPLFSDLYSCVQTVSGPQAAQKESQRGFLSGSADYRKYAAAVWLDRKRLKAFVKEDSMVDSSLQKLSPQYGQNPSAGSNCDG